MESFREFMDGYMREASKEGTTHIGRIGETVRNSIEKRE